MHFDWYAYLESVGGAEAPADSFIHVESSLISLLPQNSVCEIEKGNIRLKCMVDVPLLLFIKTICRIEKKIWKDNT